MFKTKRKEKMKKKLKKLTLFLITTLVSLSIITPVSAQKNIINNETNPEYIYNYNGVEFIGDTELSEEQLKSMYENAMNANLDLLSKESTFETFAEVPGSSQVKVIPPYYRTYKNTGAKIAAELISFHIVNKVPKKIRTTAFGSWVLNKIQGWATIKTTYVGSWVTSSWSNYQNKRVYHATLVHYKNSNYTSPKTIQYYDVSHMY